MRQYQITDNFEFKLQQSIGNLEHEVIRTSCLIDDNIWIGAATRPKILKIVESANSLLCRQSSKKMKVFDESSSFIGSLLSFGTSPKHIVTGLYDLKEIDLAVAYCESTNRDLKNN